MNKIDHPILILIRGLPGGGKSYLAAELLKVLGPENVLSLDPDTIDLDSAAFKAFSEQKTKEGIEKKFHPYRWSREKAYAAIEANKIIMWNQPFTHAGGFNRTVTNLEEYALHRGIKLPVLVVEVEIDPEIAKARVEARKKQGGHGPSAEAWEQFIADYTSFAASYNTVQVNGQDDVAVSKQTVLAAIDKLR